MSSEKTRCTQCSREVEACACCDSPDCRTPLCYPDLTVLVGQSLPQPHTHGG